MRTRNGKLLNVNINCLTISRIMHQETLRTSRSDVLYQTTPNTINYSESRISVLDQTGVRTQASELISESEQEQISSLHSDRREETDSKTVILSSDGELTGKNEDGLTDKNENKLTDKTDDDDHASDISDASTVARSIQKYSLDEDECSEPKIIQMSEVTSTEPVNDIAEYSPVLEKDIQLDTRKASLSDEMTSVENLLTLDKENHLNTTEASLPEVKISSGKPKIIADEILTQKVLVRRSGDREDINANVDMTNVISSKFLGFESHEREESFNYNLAFSLAKLNDKNRNSTSVIEGEIEDSLSMPKTVELEDSLDFSQETAKSLTFVNKTRDVTVSIEGRTGNSLTTSSDSEKSKDFFGSSQEAVKALTFTKETRDIFGAEGKISNSLNTSASSEQLGDFLGFPQKASLENLSNFQDLIENVEFDPVTYEFANIVRDTSNRVRSKSPSYSYLRNNLPDQVEPLETDVFPRNYIRSSILRPISNRKSSGYLELIPIIKKLTTLDNEELTELQSRLKSKRHRLIKKAELKLQNKSQEEKKKFKAPNSMFASRKSKRSLNKVEKVSCDYCSDRIKTRGMIRESMRREKEEKNALLGRTDSRYKTRTLFAKISNNSLKVEEIPKDVPQILQSKKLSFADCENGQNNFKKSVVSPLSGGDMLKEVRIYLTPVSISCLKKNFENKEQLSDSIFDASLVPVTNPNFGNDFDVYEHLNYSKDESIKDSIDENQFTQNSSFEKKSLSDLNSVDDSQFTKEHSFEVKISSDLDPPKNAINVRKSPRIRKRPLKLQSYLTSSRVGVLTKPKSQVKKVSKKVTFSSEVTVHYYKKTNKV